MAEYSCGPNTFILYTVLCCSLDRQLEESEQFLRRLNLKDYNRMFRIFVSYIRIIFTLVYIMLCVFIQ